VEYKESRVPLRTDDRRTEVNRSKKENLRGRGEKKKKEEFAWGRTWVIKLELGGKIDEHFRREGLSQARKSLILGGYY